jgi:hypothetical protein
LVGERVPGGVWLMETMLAHPDLQDLRRIFLATADAHVLYARCSYEPLPGPERFLSIERPGVRPFTDRPRPQP